MELQEGEILLKKRIEDKYKHKWYKRTVEYAKKMTALITGEGLDEMMQQFVRREDEMLFKQRKEITQHIVTTVSKNLIKPQYKVPRSNNVQRIITYEENGKADKLEAILNKFWGEKSLDEYMRNRWIQLNNLDPNSFIVLTWKDFNNKKEHAQPFPEEYRSINVYDYKYTNFKLDYLLLGWDDKEYLMYFSDGAIRMKKYELDQDDIKELVEIGEEKYIKTIYMYNLGFVPAFMVGITDDLYTNISKISIIDDAVPLLMKLIPINSELDLTMKLHAFPQKIQHVKPCNNCNHGFLPSGKECTKCNGTGHEKVAVSAQEAILLEMPRSKEDMMQLDNIVKYITPAVDIIKIQIQYIKDLTAQCKEAMYNTELFSKKEISETATGKNIDLQNVYDALYPMALGFSDAWRFIVKSVAKITDLEKGLICNYIFSKDFKMQSLSEYYNDLKIISDSKAAGFIKSSINDDIARIIYQDDPLSMAKYNIMRAFNPFSDKTPEEITFLMASPYVSEFSKTLYANYGLIFDEIMFEHPDFFIMKKELQWKLIVEYITPKIPKKTETFIK
jgi:hypothetical protein